MSEQRLLHSGGVCPKMEVSSEDTCSNMEDHFRKRLTRIAKESDILAKMLERSGGMGCVASTVPQPGLTESHKATIKKSWSSFVSKGDLTDLGMPMFIKLFEDAPEVKPLFNFAEDSASNNIKLQNHVKGVFEVVGTAVDMIDDLGQLSPVVVDLGSRHYHYGARKEHLAGVFEVVGTAVDMIDDLGQLSPVVVDLGSRHYHYGARKEHLAIVGKCLVHALSKGLGDEFTEDVKNAWLSFYNWLGGCFAKGVTSEATKK